MATKRSPLPIARQEQLIIEEILDETIIYDLRRNRAHSLNRTAAFVWRHCDGRTGVRALARLLAKARLLDVSPTPPGPSATYSRRAVMQTLGSVGRVALVLPVVHSILTPLAAQAQSCIAAAACRDLTPPACNGQPVCSPPSNKCCTETSPTKCRPANCP